MILKVNKDICEIKQNEVWNVGDYNVHTVQVELSEEFDGLVNKVRYFVEENSYDMLITDNVAEVPREATLMEGMIRIGVYGYDADTDILVQSTSPVNKYIASGTYTGEADNTEPLTPTDKQQMETAIQKNTDDIIDLQNNKQDVLISGENIKTINNESILGTGNIEIDVGSIDYNDLENKPTINNIELKGNKSLNDLGIQPSGNYATMNDLTEESRAIFNEIETTYYNKNQTNNLLNNKQNTLVSGQNIKTINNESLLGEGNINIQSGGSSNYEDLENLPKINNIEIKGNKSLNDLGIQPEGDYALESDMTEAQNDIENLQTENERLKATLPTTTGDGQDITLDKTAEMEFVKPPLPRGNTKQNTTTGKNLLPPLDSGSLNGLTFTTNSNGITTISGTTTSVTTYFKNVNKILPAGTYTLSINLSYTPPANSSQLILQDINNVRLATINLWKITSKTFTLSADTEIKNYYLFSTSGIQHNGTISIQLEKGSTATSYEPYTGGIPSPNPSYPQEVEVVTGNVGVTISNENNTESKTLPVSLGNIELCKIGNYQDVFIKENNDWKIPNKTIKIDNYNGETITTPYISTTGGLDIGATVYYVGTNDLLITDVTLISQLEEISKTLSYQGQTNITSNTIALFDVEAYQSTKLILQNLDSRLTLVEG